MSNLYKFNILLLSFILFSPVFLKSQTDDSILEVLDSIKEDEQTMEAADTNYSTQQSQEISDDLFVDEPVFDESAESQETQQAQESIVEDITETIEPVQAEPEPVQVQQQPEFSYIDDIGDIGVTELDIAEPEPEYDYTSTTEQQDYRTHKVWIWQETRDCLWNLAEKYYGDPWLWKLIYQANQDKIEDPRKIYPKQVLIIPPLEK